MGFMDTVQSVLDSVMDLPNKAVNSLGNLEKKAHEAATQELHKVQKVQNVTEPITAPANLDSSALLEKTNAYNDDAYAYALNYDDAINDLVSDMIETIQEDGESPLPPLADKLITAFEVPVNQTGNLLVEIVEDATGKAIDFYQEVDNATENAKNVVVSTTAKVLIHSNRKESANYYDLSIIILFVVIAFLVVGVMILYFVRSKKRQDAAYNNNSGVYNVEEAAKTNIQKKGMPNFHNVSLA